MSAAVPVGAPTRRRILVVGLLVFTVVAHVACLMRDANPWRLVALDSVWTGIIVMLVLALAWPSAWLAATLALRPGRARRIGLRVLGAISGCYILFFLLVAVFAVRGDEPSRIRSIGRVSDGQLTWISVGRSDPSCPDIDVQYDGGLLSTHRRFFACAHEHTAGVPAFALRGNLLVETWDDGSCTFTVDAAHLMLTTTDETCVAWPSP